MFIIDLIVKNVFIGIFVVFCVVDVVFDNMVFINVGIIVVFSGIKDFIIEGISGIKEFILWEYGK